LIASVVVLGCPREPVTPWPQRCTTSPADGAKRDRAPSVLFALPNTSPSMPRMITIGFSRPMVDPFAATTTDVPDLDIAPSVEGSLEWVGSRTLMFRPAGCDCGRPRGSAA
jgi:hypothetical protein